MNVVYGYMCKKEDLVDNWHDKPMIQYGKLADGSDYAIHGEDCLWYDHSIPFEFVDDVIVGDFLTCVPAGGEDGIMTFDAYDVNMEVRENFKWVANDVFALTGKRVGMSDLHFYAGVID